MGDNTVNHAGRSTGAAREFTLSILNKRQEKVMKKSSIFIVIAFAFVLLSFGVSGAEDYPIMDMIANKVIQKYQTSNCEQLWEQKSKPKSPKEQEFIQILRADPQMRTAFINKVAAPIVNKMFECGMIP
jgi:hypothetical protein